MDNQRTLGRTRLTQFSFNDCAHQTATILNQHLIPNP
jgi:hypothetical protein